MKKELRLGKVGCLSIFYTDYDERNEKCEHLLGRQLEEFENEVVKITVESMDWDWFDWGKHESRLAKYWASEEMAADIIIKNGTGGNYKCQLKRDYLKLSQLLKKEWFRS